MTKLKKLDASQLVDCYRSTHKAIKENVKAIDELTAEWLDELYSETDFFTQIKVLRDVRNALWEQNDRLSCEWHLRGLGDLWEHCNSEVIK